MRTVEVHLPRQRVLAHYESRTYVCAACRLSPAMWEVKGQPPCKCPPHERNLPPGADGEPPFDLDEWLRSLA